MAKKKRTNPRRQQATKADIEKTKKQATRDAMIFSLTVPLMVLHDFHGFGPNRLEAVCDEMIHKYKDLDAGLFTVDDANEWLWDYAGIRVEE